VARNRVMNTWNVCTEIPLEEKTRTARAPNCFAGRVDACDWAEKRERLQQVRAAVQIAGGVSRAVVLCELEEMSYEEAAQMADARLARFVRGCTAVAPADGKLEIFRGVPQRASVAR